MRRIFKLFLVAAAAIPAAGLLYQRAGARRDRKRFLKPDALIDIGEGRSMYLSQRGTGSPTVIFESGISATSLNWTHLQQAVSTFTRAVSYDRAGLGWSSPCVSPRTPSNIVRELRTLLQSAGIPPPYILVGHSFGGVVVRRFATDHPAEVAGLILVDPMRPEDWSGQNSSQIGELNQGELLTTIGLPCAHLGLARLALTSLLTGSGKVARILGRAAGADGQRVFDRLICEVGKMPPETRPIVAAHWSSPHFYRGMAAHLRAVPATVLEMQEAKPIEEIPVILLTPATAEPLTADALQRIGSSTRQLFAEKSGHWIHLDEPALVLEAIRTVIARLRSDTGEDAEAMR
jgi:pimeloyl-ACP methyl ester carboxylesterase